MPADDTSPRLGMAAGSVATTLASAGVVYDLWAAFSYDNDTASLVPFAIATCIGVIYATFELHCRSRPITGFGLLLTTPAPVGFTWISSIASLFVGTALLFREILKYRRQKR